VTKDSFRRMQELFLVAMAALLIAGSLIGLGRTKLSYQIAAFALVVLACYFVFQYVILKLVYLQIHRRRILVTSDSPDLRRQVRVDVALIEHRVGAVLLVPMLMFVGSIYKGIGVGIALLLALAIIVYAQKLKII